MSVYKNRSREVNYVGRDFTSLKSNLIELAQNYFPNSVKDIVPSKICFLLNSAQSQFSKTL